MSNKKRRNRKAVSEDIGSESDGSFIKIHQARDNLSSDEDEGEWEEVRDLEVGDEIRLDTGGWARILDLKFRGKGEVFNFSVANNNNYYVGNSRLRTHNSNCGVGEYLAKKNPDPVTHGTSVLKGQYVHELDRVELWIAKLEKSVEI